MQPFKCLRYFFYLAGNWNLRIASYIIKHEVRGEKKYGIQTTGADELRSLEDKGIDITHSTIYMPASYDLLEEVFTKHHIQSFQHFVDIGCGKGRSMCVAAAFGVKKVTGIDLSKEFCEASKKNLEIIKQTHPQLVYKIYNNDAFYFDIDNDVDCIFLFNPFDDTIMSGVLENIEVSLENKARKITIIYVNPLQKHLLLDSGYKETDHIQRMQYLEVSVFEK